MLWARPERGRPARSAAPDGPGDLDILVASHLQPAVHRDRLPWLAHLGRQGRAPPRRQGRPG